MVGKKRKVLITGLGSIGQRHARCLRELYGESVELYAFRSRGLDHIITDDLKMIPGVSQAGELGIREYRDLNKVLSLGMDAVFVTNPPDLHISTAIKSVKAGANVFIEKPLSHSLEGIDELIRESERAGIICMVGHQMRYHKVIKRLQDIISKGLLGNIVSAEFVFGEYLPGMHPYEDYSITHAAVRERGGGSILSLNHDIDIACYLLGMPERLFCMGGKNSHLKIKAEDTAHILMQVPRGKNSVFVHILLDFIQRPKRREWIIIGDSGKVRVDLVSNVFRLDVFGKGNNESYEEDFSDFKRNEMFLAEISIFFDSIENKKNGPIGLVEARDILKVALSARDSLASGQPVKFF